MSLARQNPQCGRWPYKGDCVIFIIAIIILLVLVAAYHIGVKYRATKYIFSSEHYREIIRWVKSVIDKHPIEKPSFKDGSAKLTTGGLALAYTSEVEGNKRVVHFSISKCGYTPDYIGSRIIFLLVRLLHMNKCEGDLFKTQTTVFHAVFKIPENIPLNTAEENAAIQDMNLYQPLPINMIHVARPANTVSAYSDLARRTLGIDK